MEQPKILIVEDNDVLRRDMKNSLYGNDITVFESSYKTVFQTYVSKEDIDLILLGSFCSADSHVLHLNPATILNLDLRITMKRFHLLGKRATNAN